MTVRVAPEGKDGAVTSLAGARDAVRAARAAGDTSEVRVIFAAGTYAMTEPVVFEPRDSGVIYEAAPGARVILTGGKRIE
ncbi:MAG: right-handed parallel beta-helix repeat-containing protein, partial [Chthoniobacteraceae bacterium]